MKWLKKILFESEERVKYSEGIEIIYNRLIPEFEKRKFVVSDKRSKDIILTKKMSMTTLELYLVFIEGVDSLKIEVNVFESVKSINDVLKEINPRLYNEETYTLSFNMLDYVVSKGNMLDAQRGNKYHSKFTPSNLELVVARIIDDYDNWICELSKDVCKVEKIYDIFNSNTKQYGNLLLNMSVVDRSTIGVVSSLLLKRDQTKSLVDFYMQEINKSIGTEDDHVVTQFRENKDGISRFFKKWK